MAFTWTLEPQTRLVRLQYAGPATAAEWAETLEAILRDPAYATGFRWLVDRRGAPPVTTEFAAAVARFLESHMAKLQGARVALLISESSTDYGMARMQEALNSFAGLETKAFRSEEHALAWLRR